MLDIVATLAGIAFGAIGAYLGLRSYVAQLRDSFQQQQEKLVNQNTDAKLKEYAAQRDFAHLQRNYEQLHQGLNHHHDALEEVVKQMIEMKNLNLSIYHRVEALAARIDGSTGGWSKKDL